MACGGIQLGHLQVFPQGGRGGKGKGHNDDKHRDGDHGLQQSKAGRGPAGRNLVHMSPLRPQIRHCN
jgi:hypothetical protein